MYLLVLAVLIRVKMVGQIAICQAGHWAPHQSPPRAISLTGGITEDSHSRL
jgi:hypothetical protein